MSMRPLWMAGLTLGIVVGFPVASFGFPALILAAAVIAFAFIGARSPVLLSGAFTGVGGIWIALLIRAQLACDAFDRAPQQGCQGYSVEPFAMLGLAVLFTGVLLGALAWRRATR